MGVGEGVGEEEVAPSEIPKILIVQKPLDSYMSLRLDNGKVPEMTAGKCFSSLKTITSVELLIPQKYVHTSHSYIECPLYSEQLAVETR